MSTVEIGIPVYKARDTLPALFDSLISQTDHNFIITMCADGEKDIYTDIYNTYTARGLKIKYLSLTENRGPGMARQCILDNTTADYIIFCDADDIAMPRMVEVLHREIERGDYDLFAGSFIKEGPDGQDILMSTTENVVTWFHAKIYRVQYLRDAKIFFLPELRIDEDSYFNLLAWNMTSNKGITGEVLYLWRDNKNSLTRRITLDKYTAANVGWYIYGQIIGLIRLIDEADIEDSSITKIMLQIYYQYMNACGCGADMAQVDSLFEVLRTHPRIKDWVMKGTTWVDIVQQVKGGAIIHDKIIFYKDTFDLWAKRLLKEKEKNENIIWTQSSNS